MELEDYRNALGLPVIPPFTPLRSDIDVLIIKNFDSQPVKKESVKEQKMTEETPVDVPAADKPIENLKDEAVSVTENNTITEDATLNAPLSTSVESPTLTPSPATPAASHVPPKTVTPPPNLSMQPNPATSPMSSHVTPSQQTPTPPTPQAPPVYPSYDQQYYHQQYYPQQQYGYPNWGQYGQPPQGVPQQPQGTPGVPGAPGQTYPPVSLPHDAPASFANMPTSNPDRPVAVPGLADLPRDVSFFDEHATIIDTKTKKEPPEMGWRSTVKKILPFINIGKGRAERDFDEINDSIFKTLSDTKKIGVMSLSGGSGSSVSAVIISSICAERKGSRGIISIDANKDGNLGDRVSDRKANGNVTIAARSGNVVTAAQINDLCTHNKDGVKVLAADRTPDYHSLTSNDYDALVKKLSPHYELILVDVPHAFNDPTLPGILQSLDGVFICTTTATDHIKNMEILINKLRNPHIVSVPPKIVVIMGHHVKGKPKARIAGVMSHLLSDRKIPAALFVPFDEHIDEGGPIRYEALGKKTKYQYRKAVANMLDLIPSR